MPARVLNYLGHHAIAITALICSLLALAGASYAALGAALPPGPSRLVEAVYAGAGTLEPATSPVIKLSVPAKITLRITPRRVAWNATIVLSGRLQGGYVPPDGVALRLRVGFPGGPVTLHALRSNAAGRFRLPWSFGSGNGIARWPLWISTISTESDYAFAPASSPHVIVTFGGNPR